MTNLELHFATACASVSLLIHAWQQFREPALKVYRTLKANGGVTGICLTIWRGEQQSNKTP